MAGSFEPAARLSIGLDRCETFDYCSRYPIRLSER